MSEKAALDSIKSSSSINPIEQLYANLIENTYFKSPVIADTYKNPYNPDDLYQKNFDYSTYEKMVNDDQVSVCLKLKKDLILGDGGQIISTEENQDEILEDIEQALFKDYEGSFNDDLEEILTAYEFGVSLTEKIYKLRPDNSLALKCLKTRHPNAWLLYQDDKGHVTKYEQRTSAGNISVDPRTLIHFINDKRFQNPYGNSDLRSAYNAWFTKMHITRFFSIFLEKAASPIPVGTYNKNAPPGVADKILQVLQRFQTKTAITIPEDVKVEFLEAKNNGDVYHKAIHLFNMIIGRSLFVPDLVGFTGSETGGGSLALGKEQMNLFFKHITRRRNSLEDVINKEIIAPIIQYNWGFVENPPKFKFKPIDDTAAVDLAKTWLEAVKGNVYQANDEEINHFRKLVKFPEGEVTFKQAVNPFQGSTPNEEIKSEEKDDKEESKESEADKKEFAKAYDSTPGDYSKKVNFKAMKTKLDDYDKSLMNECTPIVNKMLMDLYDQVSKKKIVQNQNVERIDGLNLKYKKDLKTVLKNSFFQIYRDSINQAKVEVTKSNFAKPLDPAKFLEVLDEEVFQYIGDYEYAILKKTRVELIAAIKDGRPLSSVLSVLSKDLEQLSQVSLERYGRTKHTEVMNNGRYDYFQSTGVVTGYQYSAIMDDRTSDICSGLHGKFFTADNAPIPPMHFNCRSTLIPITKFESFKPTETIRGESVDKFIEDNKASGFSKFSNTEKKNELEVYEPEVTDIGVEFETQYLDGNTEIIKYSINGNVFQETTIVYKSDKKIEGEYSSIKHRRIK